jgi:hypothetical protein
METRICEYDIGFGKCGNKNIKIYTEFGRYPKAFCSSCFVLVQRDFEIRQLEDKLRKEKTDGRSSKTHT